MRPTTWVAVAALMMALAVAFGAFGAHGLKSILTAEQLGTWQTAVNYHFFHAVSLLAVSLFASSSMSAYLHRTMMGLVLGLVLFSGSLYMWVLTGMPWLVFMTPIGGLIWIITWLYLSWHVWRQGVKTSRQS